MKRTAEQPLVRAGWSILTALDDVEGWEVRLIFSATLMILVSAIAPGVSAQTTDAPLTLEDVAGIPSERPTFPQLDHPAINYEIEAPADAVAVLNGRLLDGSAHLKFDGAGGYLQSLLDTLGVSVDTQLLVFSKASLQRKEIEPKNPRALYFADNIIVTFIRGAPLLEITVQDHKQGMIFYVLEQKPVETAVLERGNGKCVNCHVTRTGMGMPGTINRSVATQEDGWPLQRFGSYAVDHRSPLAQRWGGSYVTGITGAKHMGNTWIPGDEIPDALPDEVPPKFSSLAGQFDLAGYPTNQSDAAARLVFDHQMHMMDLITRVGWDARVALHQEPGGGDIVQAILKNDALELVDYMLFVDEADMADAVVAPSKFSKSFTAKGPRDRKGRSLRELDLKTRVMRYPCSYMIYSAAFDALPAPAKDAIYSRLWDVLSGSERSEKYVRLASADRKAIVEILRDTKSDLPRYFR